MGGSRISEKGGGGGGVVKEGEGAGWEYPARPARGSAVSSPSGVWGGAPDANAFLSYHAQNTTLNCVQKRDRMLETVFWDVLADFILSL